MAIPPELAKYANEAAFRDQMLIPLLQRLGFSLVTNYHGQREFGRDIVFAEVDRFGHVVYHALQAKHVGSIGLGEAAQDLIRDAQQAFANPFRHPQTGSDHRISVFYAVNSGSISEQARDHIFNSLHYQFGGNVRLIDGPGVIALDRLASFTRGQLVRERLAGLVHEMRYNRKVCDTLRPYLENFETTPTTPFQRSRTQAVLALLEQPVLLNVAEFNLLERYWEEASMMNRCLDALISPLAVVKWRQGNARNSLEKLNLVVQFGDMLIPLIQAKLVQLGVG